MSANEDTLKQLIIVSRHGNRTPEMKIPEFFKTSLPEEFKVLGCGQLTKVGRNNMFKLGEVLRQRYDHFLTDNPKLIEVNASYYPRCIESAQCTLASLFPPKGIYQWNPNINWQPISITAKPKEAGNLLMNEFHHEHFYEYRPKAESLEQFKVLLQKMTKYSAWKITNFKDLIYLYDLGCSLETNCHPVPDICKEFNSEIKAIFERFFKKIYDNPDVAKRISGPLLEEIRNNLMQEKVSNDGRNNIRTYFYCGHDTSIAGLGGLLKLGFNGQPPLGSSVLIEKHVTSDNTPHVKFFWLDISKDPVSFDQIHPLNDTICTIDDMFSQLNR